MAHSERKRHYPGSLIPFRRRNLPQPEVGVVRTDQQPPIVAFPPPNYVDMDASAKLNLDIENARIAVERKMWGGRGRQVMVATIHSLASAGNYIDSQRRVIGRDMETLEEADENNIVLHSPDGNDSSNAYFQQIGGLFMAADIWDGLKSNSAFLHLRREMDEYVTLSRKAMIPDLEITENGIRIEDFRKGPEAFLQKHTLGAFLDVALNIGDREDGQIKIENYLGPGGLIATALVNARKIIEERRNRTAADKKAINKAIPSLHTIQDLADRVTQVVLDPQHPDHSQLTNRLQKFIDMHPQADAKGYLSYVLGGKDKNLLAIYRTVYELQDGPSGPFYKELLRVLRENHLVAKSRRMFVEEAQGFRLRNAKIDVAEQDETQVLDVAENMQKLRATTQKGVHLLDPVAVPAWGFKTPSAASLVLDKQKPHLATLELSYGDEENSKKLSVSVDSKTYAVDWSIMEPISSDPKLASQLVYVLGKAIEVVRGDANTPQSEATLFDRGAQNGHKRRKNQELNPDTYANRLGTETENGKAHEIKRSIFFVKGTMADMVRGLSSTDQQIVISAIGRFNSGGSGTFEMLHIRYEGRRVYELKSSQQGGGSGIRVFCAEIKDGIAGQQKFEIIRIEYRHHLKRKDWGGHG